MATEIRPRLTQEEYDWFLANRHKIDQSTPPDHIIKGVSTLFDADGSVKLQWHKTAVDKQELVRQTREICEALADGVKPVKATKPPKGVIKDHLTVYPMGDPHIGLYSWAKETGEDFDCDIAERNLVAATSLLTANALPTEQAVIVNLGDFFHSDNLENRTARSGHALDVDSRWPRVVRVGVRAMVSCIQAALEKHKTVHVYNVIGNHDDQSAMMLSMILEAYYRKESRVVIDDGVSAFGKFRFGKVLLGFHHGHNVKMEALPGVMASEWAEDWGQTQHRYWLTGHIHHQQSKDLPGCKVESFRTLAARDAWAASKGYLSPRDMHRITYHKDYGERGREIVPVGMLDG